MKKKDYSHLKGMELWLYNSNGERYVANRKSKAKGFVAEIDFKKGITIKHKDTQVDLICLRADGHYRVSYKKYFDHIVSCVKNGSYKRRRDPNQLRATTKGTFNGCAFEESKGEKN